MAEQIYPKFEGSDRQIVEQAIRWMNANIERRIWSKQELEQKFFKRSPSEMLRDRDTFFAEPCLDLASVLAELLYRSKLEPVVLMSANRRFMQPVKIHFSVEIGLEGIPHLIDITRSANRIVPKEILKRKRMEIIGKIIPNANSINSSYLGLFGFHSLQELDRKIKGFSMNAYRRRIFASNTKRQFDKLMERRIAKANRKFHIA